MMKRKPSWGLWLTWVLLYTALDFLVARFWHGAFLRADTNDAIEGAVFAGTLTWLIALYKWHKEDSGL